MILKRFVFLLLSTLLLYKFTTLDTHTHTHRHTGRGALSKCFHWLGVVEAVPSALIYYYEDHLNMSTINVGGVGCVCVGGGEVLEKKKVRTTKALIWRGNMKSNT